MHVDISVGFGTNLRIGSLSVGRISGEKGGWKFEVPVDSVMYPFVKNSSYTTGHGIGAVETFV